MFVESAYHTGTQFSDRPITERCYPEIGIFFAICFEGKHECKNLIFFDSSFSQVGYLMLQSGRRSFSPSMQYFRRTPLPLSHRFPALLF